MQETPQEEKTESRKWAKQVLEEYRDYENPSATADIDVVWAISGRGAYNAEPTPYLLSSPEFAKSDLFREDDRQQTDFAAQLVREITAIRLNKNVKDILMDDIKKSGPILFYNGTNLQNKQFRDAIESGSFPIPPNKIKIETLSETDDPKDANTLTQFQRFPKELLEELIAKNQRMALVQARWHLPRIARTINSRAVLEQQPLWDNTNIIYFVSDKTKEDLPKDSKSVTKRAIDIRSAILGEGARINAYIKTGTDNPKPRYS
ncbi:MAG: hypothetical protein HY425_00700 [Candidatus Levybacteria bacterium]|nr:hypothetical protein [Candidatus Levybacteria bacterium]